MDMLGRAGQTIIADQLPRSGEDTLPRPLVHPRIGVEPARQRVSAGDVRINVESLHARHGTGRPNNLSISRPAAGWR